jgi:cytidylate kinase
MSATRITLFVGAITAAMLLAASIAAAQSSQSRRQEVRPSTAGGIFDSRSPPHIVLGGRDMGTDPDPRIRAYIGRDSGMAFGGNF